MMRESAHSRPREGLTLHWLDGSLTQHQKAVEVERNRYYRVSMH